jgi:hypothetical protein
LKQVQKFVGLFRKRSSGLLKEFSIAVRAAHHATSKQYTEFLDTSQND